MAREESSEPLPSLDRMEAEAERVNELIGQTLSLSLLESTGELHPQPVLVEDIISSITEDMRFEATNRGCTYTIEVQTLHSILGNRELLRRALENVTCYTIRHSAAGGEVRVKAMSPEQSPLASPAIHVVVIDAGPGSAEASLPHIFRAF